MATIFYVEDEMDLRDDVAMVLSEAGYEVLTAADGTEALQMIHDHKPDLVISDINLPNMTGRELLTEVKDMYPATEAPPFIFLTALFDENERAHGLSLGAVDYMVKPVDFDELLSRVNALMRAGGNTPEADRMAKAG